MMFSMLKGKIHRATVVQAELNYVGSITIDEDLLDAAGILEYDKVHIVDVNNGARFETYTIAGERGSGMICLNGAAARSCQVGDEVIISLSKYVTNDEMASRKAKVLTFNHDSKINTIDEILEYDFISQDDEDWQFKINKIH